MSKSTTSATASPFTSPQIEVVAPLAPITARRWPAVPLNWALPIRLNDVWVDRVARIVEIGDAVAGRGGERQDLKTGAERADVQRRDPRVGATGGVDDHVGRGIEVASVRAMAAATGWPYFSQRASTRSN